MSTRCSSPRLASRVLLLPAVIVAIVAAQSAVSGCTADQGSPGSAEFTSDGDRSPSGAKNALSLEAQTEKRVAEEIASLNESLNASDQYRLSPEDLALLQEEVSLSEEDAESLKTLSQ